MTLRPDACASAPAAARRSTSTRSPAPAGCTPTWSAASSPSGCSSPIATPPARCGSRRPSSPRVARIQRLRAGLGLNYAALGLVLDLLDRIAELEARSCASRYRDAPEARPWT